MASLLVQIVVLSTITFSCISCFDFSPFTNVSMTNIMKEIKEIDNSLLDMFSSLPKGAGTLVLKYMKRYVQAMKEMVHYATENKTRVRIEANDLIEQVGPDFLDYPFDKDKIRDNFEWESEDYDKMYELRMKTVKVWNDFQDHF